MGKIIKIRDVFKSSGQPTTTYVEREDGLYENKLHRSSVKPLVDLLIIFMK